MAPLLPQAHARDGTAAAARAHAMASLRTVAGRSDGAVAADIVIPGPVLTGKIPVRQKGRDNAWAL
jgi:hypothetical protein